MATTERQRKGQRRSGLFRRLVGDERGIVALQIALSATLLFGATALSFDIGRLMIMQSELQSAADAAALAGAAELNGQSGAIARATAAATGAFGTNWQTLANDNLGFAVTVQTPVFFSALSYPNGGKDPPLLPPDLATTSDGTVTTSDKDAAFIKVAVVNRSIANAFITFIGGPALQAASASATAGYTQIICQSLPLMICNPLETNTSTTFNPQTGDQLVVKRAPGNAWAPGNYGFLSAPANTPKQCGFKGNSGSADISILLATNFPPGCFSSTVHTRTGDANNMSQALNVRLDVYQVSGNTVSSTNSCFSPAPDVIKGMVPTVTQHGNHTTTDPCTPIAPVASSLSCPNADPTVCAFGMPQDKCFVNGTNCNLTGILGNGDWDLNTYWAKNHGGTPPAALTTFAQGLSPAGITPAGIPSRYATYLYEINNGIPRPGTPVGHVENGDVDWALAQKNNLACYSGSSSNVTSDRRLLNVAVVNCLQQGVTGNKPGIRPAGVMQGFMIMPSNGNGDIFVEVVKVVQPNGADGILHNVVQLYR